MIEQKDLAQYRDQSRILFRDDSCLYLLPHPALRGWFSNFTISFPKNIIPQAYTVIPHGCATMVLTYVQGGLHCRLLGPAVSPVQVGDQAVNFDMLFIVEFQPAGLYALTGAGQKELAGRLLPLEEINPLLCCQALETLETADTVEELTGRMETLLLKYIKAPYRQPEFAEAVELIIEHGGRATVKELSQAVFYSERHLNRMFSQQLGMSPKEFSRLVRMNNTLRLMQAGKWSLAEICALQGFYDQSHFNREFQTICGATPQNYLKRMSDFYNEIAKF